MRKKRLRHKNKKLQGQLYKYEFADPEIQRPLEGSRKVAWAKLGVWPLHGGEKQKGLSEGHAVMASQWLDVGKKEHLRESQITPRRGKAALCHVGIGSAVTVLLPIWKLAISWQVGPLPREQS